MSDETNSNDPNVDKKLLAPPPATRVGSVDAMRGLTILLMVFVNDLGPAAPAWMHHIQPPDADGMTLADIVFPFFLFIAGVSIPLAVEASDRRGVSRISLLGHIITRTLALLLMGLVGVNRSDQTSTDPQFWGLLAYVGIILAWVIVPREPGRRRIVMLTLKGIGFVLLIAMLAIFRREGVETEVLFLGTVENWTWLRTQWWGIRGLIGWAYLVASCVYLLLGHRREWLALAVVGLMSSYLVAGSGGYFTHVDGKAWLEPLRPGLDALQSLLGEIDSYVSLSSQLGSLPAIVVSGSMLGTILTSRSDVSTPGERIRWALLYSSLLFIAGLATDTFGGINKIAATPTWCFWCASLATLLWVSLYWLMDIKGINRWAIAIRPAGANPLIAYLLHPIVLFILGLSGMSVWVRGYAVSSNAWVAIVGSLVMASVVCALTGLIAKAGIRVRV